jgi:DNA polymerase III sliding clamp (beta) subunit (PCNA family)
VNTNTQKTSNTSNTSNTRESRGKLRAALDIRAAVTFLKRFSDNRPELPILAYTLVSVSRGYVSLTVYNMETGVTVKTPAADYTGESFKTCVPFRDLERAVSKLKTGELEFSFTPAVSEIRGEKNELERAGEPERFTISNGRASFTFNGKPAAEFPKLPESDTSERERVLSAEFNELAAALKFVTLAVSCEMPLHYTSGALFSFDLERGARIIGTDGHRLHVINTPGKPEFNESRAALIPGKTIEKLAGAKLPESSRFTLTLSDNLAEYKISNGNKWSIELVTHLLDTPYPDFNAVIPESYARALTLSPAEMVTAADTLAVIAKHESGRDLIVIRNGESTGELELASISDTGRAVTSVNPLEIDYRDKITSYASVLDKTGRYYFGFNYSYFAECFKLAAKNEPVTLELSGSLEPAVTRFNENGKLAVLMPVRLPESREYENNGEHYAGKYFGDTVNQGVTA